MKRRGSELNKQQRIYKEERENKIENFIQSHFEDVKE